MADSYFMTRWIMVLLLLSLAGKSVEAKYQVRGQVNLGEEWQPKMFMAAVHNLNDYYRTSSKLIINTAEVDAEGNFVLAGENLPDEKMFYRLYLMKNDNTDFDACLYVGGDDHNFVHLVLDNSSEVEVTADPASLAPFGSYVINGQTDNLLMRELSSIVFPSFYFYKIQFPTELRFSEEKLHSDLKNFVDTCQNSLVALAAVNNMDFDNFFENNKEFYLQFQDRIKADLPNSPYTKNFKRKVNYYLGGEESGTNMWKWLSFGLMGLLALSLWMNLRKKSEPVNEKEISTMVTPPLTDKLTRKEQEILACIQEGKSNKEIANTLFVEVSTVKSHINKIYSKLEVSSRSELQKALKS